jgi:hypothetical protein
MECPRAADSLLAHLVRARGSQVQILPLRPEIPFTIQAFIALGRKHFEATGTVIGTETRPLNKGRPARPPLERTRKKRKPALSMRPPRLSVAETLRLLGATNHKVNARHKEKRTPSQEERNQVSAAGAVIVPEIRASSAGVARKHPCRDPGLRPSCVPPTSQLKRE